MQNTSDQFVLRDYQKEGSEKKGSQQKNNVTVSQETGISAP